MNRRELAFKIRVISIRDNDESDDSFSTISNLVKKISSFEKISDGIFKQINATIQKTDVLKPAKKRTNVTRDDSYGGVMKKLKRKLLILIHGKKKLQLKALINLKELEDLQVLGKLLFWQ